MDLLRPIWYCDCSLFTTTSEFPNLTTYTTTWTTTNSDGSVETDSGIVIVSTDSAGSLFTTTSEFPNNYGSSSSYLPLTTYTTTWTTTNSDGSVETDSGIVIVSMILQVRSSQRLLSSLTTMDILIIPSINHLHTTWTTTNSDGSVETDSGIVIVSTDSAGSLFTRLLNSLI
ncbi:CIC11C00000003600 [Sungouiella intermedia]|uniref:CIC11C00000003600 n=1 Tax=Sungouiella intermedia TaxID=45354 RepID=A0A1L0C2W9_9ASCO|nr:CIC11C00000003600 [[Candida] intermedia]